MDTGQFISLISVNVAVLGIIVAVVVWAVNKLDADIKSLSSNIEGSNRRLDSHAQRIDQVFHSSNTKHEAQMARIDQLYEMFVNLLKDRKS